MSNLRSLGNGRREDTRYRVLRVLQENPELSQRELARQVGVSLGGLNYVLQAFLEKGLVKLGNFSASSDKRRYAYVLTPRGLSEKAKLTRDFLARKTAEYEALKSEIEALQAEVEGGLSGSRGSS